MDRQTQGREIRKLMAAPDFMLGSVHAVTEDGDLVVASTSASQLGPYASWRWSVSEIEIGPKGPYDQLFRNN